MSFIPPSSRSGSLIFGGGLEQGHGRPAMEKKTMPLLPLPVAHKHVHGAPWAVWPAHGHAPRRRGQPRGALPHGAASPWARSPAAQVRGRPRGELPGGAASPGAELPRGAASPGAELPAARPA